MNEEAPRPEEVALALRLMFDTSHPMNEPAFHRISMSFSSVLRHAPIDIASSDVVPRSVAILWIIEEHGERFTAFERALVERILAEVSL